MTHQEINEQMRLTLSKLRTECLMEGLANHLGRKIFSWDYCALHSEYSTHNGKIVELVYYDGSPLGVMQLIWGDEKDFTKNAVKFTYQFTPAFNGKFILK